MDSSHTLESNADLEGLIVDFSVPPDVKADDVPDSFECESAFLSRVKLISHLFPSGPRFMVIEGWADGVAYEETISWFPGEKTYLCGSTQGRNKKITSYSLKYRVETWSENFSPDIVNQIMAYFGLTVPNPDENINLQQEKISNEASQNTPIIPSSLEQAKTRLLKCDGATIEFEGRTISIPEGWQFEIVIKGVRNGAHSIFMCNKIDSGGLLLCTLEVDDEATIEVGNPLLCTLEVDDDKPIIEAMNPSSLALVKHIVAPSNDRLPVSVVIANAIRSFLARLGLSFFPSRAESNSLNEARAVQPKHI